VYDAVASFLLTRIADDETVARSVLGRGVHDDRPEVKEWIGLANPNRMLVWSGVRRRLVQLHTPDGERFEADETAPVCGGCGQPMPCPTLMLLANLYADHPDFQEQWRQ
jgi:hypothetical protein